MSEGAVGFDAAKDSKGVLILNIMDLIQDFEWGYQHFFEQPPVGYYKVGRLEPVFLLGEQVFRYDENNNLRKVTGDFSDVNTALVDINGNQLVSAWQMQNKKKFLSAEPTFPYMAIKVAALMAKRCVFTNVAYKTPIGELESEIESYFIPQLEEGTNRKSKKYIWDSGIEQTLETLHSVIADFIGDDDWCEYKVLLVNSSLHVTKCPDVRIVEWGKLLKPRKSSAPAAQRLFKYEIKIDTSDRGAMVRIENLLSHVAKDGDIEFRINEVDYV